MTNAETKHLEAVLHAKRQEVLAKIWSRSEELHIGSGGGDIIDRIQRMSNRDETAAVLSRLSSVLTDVDRSLRAMKEGSYGLCAECEEPIAVKRLQVIPWAVYCIRCQEHFESTQQSSDASNFNPGKAA